MIEQNSTLGVVHAILRLRERDSMDRLWLMRAWVRIPLVASHIS